MASVPSRKKVKIMTENNKEKYKEFLNIAKVLNQNFIVPLLFGSLGLVLRINADYEADDIDMLVSENLINYEWIKLKSVVEQQGYVLEDLHEHQFRKNGIKIAFASIESLTPFAGVHLDDIELKSDNGVKYYLLNSEQYLAVYTASSKDSYRRNKNNDKDFDKINLIKTELSNDKKNEN